MSFEHPQGLWLLALGIPILAFHFYRGRIRKMAVPTLLFWEQVLVEEERRTALKRLRHYASLLLNLAALMVLTSAVSGPQVRGITREKARYALVLDTRASLAAAEPDGRTRMERLLARAGEFVSTLGFGDQVSVHDLSGPRQAFTSDVESVRRRLVPGVPAGHGAVGERVRAALAAGEDVTAILFTDRVPEDVDDLLESGRLRLSLAGTPRENAGWVAGLPVRRTGEKKVTLVLTAANFGAAAAGRREVLYWNGREVGRRDIALGAGERVERTWVLDPSRFPGERIEEGGLAHVALEPSDALALDDVASFVVPPLAPPPVIVFHPGQPDPLLMTALATLKAGGAIAQEIGEAPLERFASVQSRLGEGWIVIFDRVAPPASLGGGGILILGAPGDRPVEQPALADWDRDAPPNAWVDYSGLFIRRSRILRGDPLLRAVEGPVATWWSRGGQAGIELGFPLGESDIAARPTFLHLLFNFVEWASWRGTRSFAPEVRLGGALRPEHPLWIEEGELILARGERLERVPVRRGRMDTVFASAPGFMRLAAAGRSEWVAVNLFDAGESDVRERPAPKKGGALPPPAPWHARIPYAVLAVAAVLAILVVEGWLFHRGLI